MAILEGEVKVNGEFNLGLSLWQAIKIRIAGSKFTDNLITKLLSQPLELENGKTYLLECDQWLSSSQLSNLKNLFEKHFPEVTLVILDGGLRITRER